MKIIQVAEISGAMGLRTRHYRGVPPELTEITGGEDHRVEMLPAEVITIEWDASGFFLIRYLRNGEFAGDTWHQTLEDATQQAEHEFGTSEADWVAVPEDQDDPIKFVLSRQR